MEIDSGALLRCLCDQGLERPELTIIIIIAIIIIIVAFVGRIQHIIE